MTYLSKPQVDEVKSLFFQRAFNDSIAEVIENTGIHMRIDPSKIAREMLTQPENRANIKLIFGDEILKELDAFSTMAKLVNEKGDPSKARTQITRALYKIAGFLPEGAKMDDYLMSFFYGNATGQQTVATALKDAQSLLRRPTAGVVGKLGKAGYEIGSRPGLKAGLTVGAKTSPQTLRLLPSNYKTPEEIEKELSFGEMNQ